MNNSLAQPLAINLGWALIHFFWQGSLVGLLLEFALFFVGPRSTTIRYILCGSALAVMPILLVGTFLVELQHSGAIRLHPLGTAVENFQMKLAYPGKTNIGLPRQEPSLGLSFGAQLNYCMPVISLNWFLGVLLLSSRKMGGFCLLRRLWFRDVTEPSDVLLHLLRQACHKMGIKPDDITLMVSRRVEIPITMGWLKPIILFPVSLVCGLSSTEIEMLLAHELAHIYRGDFFVHLVQSAVEILFFYHPVTWWITHRIRQERELACDALVIQHFAAPVPYAKALLQLESLQVHQSLANAANGGSLLQRVQRILGDPLPSDGVMTRVIGLFALALTMPMLVAFGRTQIAQMSYPWHEGIKTTIYWIGEKSNSQPPTGDALSFYIALPFNDLKEPEKAKQWVPNAWHRNPRNGRPVSSCLNRWIEIKNGDGKRCYAQWWDVGPNLEDDAEYVFGKAQPRSGLTGAGLSVSPDVAAVLNLSSNEKTSWRFVDEASVPHSFSAANQLPLGINVGKRGFVLSPYAPDKPIVDVHRFGAESAIRCPYTGKIFIVPDDTTTISPAAQATPNPNIPLGQTEISIGQVRKSPIILEDGHFVRYLSVDLILKKSSDFEQKKLRCFFIFYKTQPNGSYALELHQRAATFNDQFLFQNTNSETFEVTHRGATDFGYVIGIYYDGRLQDSRSDPSTLWAEKPLPPSVEQ